MAESRPPALIKFVRDALRDAKPKDPGPNNPNHGRTVVQSLMAWIAVHLLLLGALGLPDYWTCHTAPDTRTSSVCGQSLGFTSLAIGWLQLFYGLGIGALIVVIGRRRRAAIAQGIFIAAGAVTLLFTALCFGVAFNG